MAAYFLPQNLISCPKHALCLLPLCHSHSLGVCGLLRENSEAKVGLYFRLEGGGDDDVLPGRQTQPRADLPQVDEELWAGAGAVGEEKVSLQVDAWAALKLRGEGNSMPSIKTIKSKDENILKRGETHTSFGICKEWRKGDNYYDGRFHELRNTWEKLQNRDYLAKLK